MLDEEVALLSWQQPAWERGTVVRQKPFRSLHTLQQLGKQSRSTLRGIAEATSFLLQAMAEKRGSSQCLNGLWNGFRKAEKFLNVFGHCHIRLALETCWRQVGWKMPLSTAAPGWVPVSRRWSGGREEDHRVSLCQGLQPL